MNTGQEQKEVSRVYNATGYIIKSENKDRSRMQRRMVETWDGMDTHREGHCRICNSSLGDDFKQTIDEWVDPKGGVIMKKVELFATVCNTCAPLVDDHYGDGEHDEDNKDNATPKWDNECPLKFRNIIQSFNPEGSQIDKPSYDIVSRWSYSRKGMYITGDSGLGKTSAVWNLFRELERETGTAPKFIKAVHLSRILARAARDVEDDPVRWLTKYKVLIIDDLGKEKITNSFAAQLFDVIDGRYENDRPTIITTKFRGGALQKRFTEAGDDSTGNDIMRRLVDSCREVCFE